MFDFNKQTAEIWIYDEITAPGQGGIDAGTVVDAVKKIGNKELTVRFNSPGGDVDEGIAIYNLLGRHSKPVTTINDALAASISNYIFMAGDTRLVAPNSRGMIHSPWCVMVGSANDFRKRADMMDEAEGIIRDSYIEKLDVHPELIASMMTEETWFNAEASLANGLATGLSNIDVEPLRVAAKMRFKNTPKDLIEPRLAAGVNHPYLPQLESIKRRAAALFATI